MGYTELNDLIYSQGNIPFDIRAEAEILYNSGSEFSEIENMIRLRTRAS